MSQRPKLRCARVVLRRSRMVVPWESCRLVGPWAPDEGDPAQGQGDTGPVDFRASCSMPRVVEERSTRSDVVYFPARSSGEFNPSRHSVARGTTPRNTCCFWVGVNEEGNFILDLQGAHGRLRTSRTGGALPLPQELAVRCPNGRRDRFRSHSIPRLRSRVRRATCGCKAAFSEETAPPAPPPPLEWSNS